MQQLSKLFRPEPKWRPTDRHCRPPRTVRKPTPPPAGPAWYICFRLSLLLSSLSVSRCFGEDTCITIPDIEAVVMVLQPSEPRITITGAERLSRPASGLRTQGGVALFQDLHISSTVTRADASAHHTGNGTVTSSVSVHTPSGVRKTTYMNTFYNIVAGDTNLSVSVPVKYCSALFSFSY